MYGSAFSIDVKHSFIKYILCILLFVTLRLVSKIDCRLKY